MANILESNIVSYVCACGHLNPITKLFFCRHCLKPRCGFCVCHEVSIWNAKISDRLSLIDFMAICRLILTSVTIVWRIFHLERQNWRNTVAINASNVRAVNILFRRGQQLFMYLAKVMQRMNRHHQTPHHQLLMLRRLSKQPHARCTICLV